MAGGKGTRLRPLTCGMPKPMVPVANRPMMEHIVYLLEKHGFKEMIATLCYMPDSIRDYFTDGSEFGCEMSYSIEDVPLGTAGSVKKLGKFTDETFVVISGDALTDIDLTKAVEYHKKNGASATIVLTKVSNPLEYGVVITDAEGRINRFLEKPSWGEVFSDTVNTGIYILEPEVMELFEEGREFDFSKNLFPMMLENKMPLYGYVADGYWCDVGTLEQYRQTHSDIMSGLVDVRIGGNEIDDNIWIGEGSEIEKGAKLIAPVIIGPQTRISRRAVVGDHSVIGSRCLVSEDSEIRRSVIWSNCYMGNGTQVRGAIVCARTSLKAHSSLFEEATVGEGCSIGEGACVKSGVKIWPDKVIDAGTHVNSSIIWGTKWNKRLFGTNGISGITNVEMTPEFASSVGASYGSCLPERSKVALGCDGKRSSEIIKDSIACGLMSSGIDVVDVGTGTTSVTRFAIYEENVRGGIHVRASSSDPDVTVLEFLDYRGINIDKGFERKIENACFTEDFRRANHESVGTKTTVESAFEGYVEAMMKNVDVQSINDAKMKVVFHCDNPNVDDVLTAVAQHVDIDVVKSGYRRRTDGEGGDNRSKTYEIDQPFCSAEHLTELVGDVVRNEASLGILFDRNAQKSILVDETGKVLSDHQIGSIECLAKAHSAMTRNEDHISMPVTSSKTSDDLARRFGVDVIRTRANPRAIMETNEDRNRCKGDENFYGFQPDFDGVYMLMQLLSMMAENNNSLSELVESLPDTIMKRETVSCPWDAKGKVMRRLIESSPEDRRELLDGVKVYHDDGWVLVMPDAEKPEFHVYSEANSMEMADEIAMTYTELIKKMTCDDSDPYDDDMTR